MFDALTRRERIRIDCIDRAMTIAGPHHDAAQIIRAAKLLETYVTGADVEAAERKLAAIDAAMQDGDEKHHLRVAATSTAAAETSRRQVTSAQSARCAVRSGSFHEHSPGEQGRCSPEAPPPDLGAL